MSKNQKFHMKFELEYYADKNMSERKSKQSKVQIKLAKSVKNSTQTNFLINLMPTPQFWKLYFSNNTWFFYRVGEKKKISYY